MVVERRDLKDARLSLISTRASLDDTILQKNSELKLADDQLKLYRQKLQDLQKTLIQKDEQICTYQSENVLVKQDIQQKLNELETMGDIIEEHTQQLEGIERKEKLVFEREEELKREREAISVLAEKVRVEQQINKRAEDKLRDQREEKQFGILKNPVNMAKVEGLEDEMKEKEKEVEQLSLKLSQAQSEINSTKKLLKQVQDENSNLGAEISRILQSKEFLQDEYSGKIRNFENDIDYQRKES